MYLLILSDIWVLRPIPANQYFFIQKSLMPLAELEGIVLVSNGDTKWWRLHYHGGQPVGATISCAHFQNGVDSRALYPGASSEGSRQRSNAN